ncbi:Na+/proline symporter/signal transduction histidine kinase [Limimaricola variabilis]|uniref:histidine kinase n=1 Tax=Limimaricola variabilis TaxID=1492771 RepID=A0ABR6HU42_9RHOB|nr:sensor histidine kinase [Limimaricola variabilis]MBB3713894.1 Na+/proline symporter/signal transduction histidine kinase [Limimaricola variabilis]
MLGFNGLIGIALVYVVFLFGVAFAAERRAATGRDGWLRSPWTYTLSLSIYCTAWTFYGAVGYAARSGLEYLTIYLGPSLVMLGWWWLLRKLVRVGRAQRITSIADLISSRYGKSTLLGVIVTLLAVVGVTPYIALQLQSIAQSLEVFARPGAGGSPDGGAVALWSAAGLALFTILFGTRNLDANERHHGIVMAIAVEAVVKLGALLAIGVFVVWELGGGPAEMLARIDASPIAAWEQSGGRWIGFTLLSAAALLCLPRMFQVLVVENADEAHLGTASWAFPLYLLLMSLFVVPIAVMGLERLPTGNPDMFVLTLPLSEGRDGLAAWAFLGGFSSAASMVMVATIALATMVSNHIVVPLWLRARVPGAVMSGDVRAVVLTARRVSIIGVLGFGYLYFRLSGGGTALAAIGLVAFVGVVQVLPALLGGLFWRGATRSGAAAGLVIGFAVWLWTMFLPSVGGGGAISAQVLAEGPFGLEWLRPQALLGTGGLDPVLHAALWSLALNAGAFVAVSLMSFPGPVERLQGAQFVGVFDQSGGPGPWSRGGADAETLLVMAQRILGATEAQAIFARAARVQGRPGALPEVTPDFIRGLERELAGSVGAATAHAMIGQLTGGVSVTVEELIAVADETAQIVEYSGRLEQKSAELERTALALRDANAQLTALSVQKDGFLSQVSHELRTPMTSIRAFAEILREGGLKEEERHRFASIIGDEAARLTRLLDDLLDLSVLEAGQGRLDWRRVELGKVIDRALAAALVEPEALRLVRDRAAEAVEIETDPDRLAQVFINLVTNARKYCDAPRPELRIEWRPDLNAVDFIDNGSGIPAEQGRVIFEKFSRLGDPHKSGGAGLGLAICREIMTRLGGAIRHLPGSGGTTFRVELPRADMALAIAQPASG